MIRETAARIIRHQGTVYARSHLFVVETPSREPSATNVKTGVEFGVALLEQRDESSLLEMLVAGQCFRDPFSLHDDEGNAIGQRPGFIGTLAVKVDAGFQ